MKVTEPPNRFFPKRAFATEDVNRDLSHAANMIRNDQDARYVYTSIRIPMACVTNRQKTGAAAFREKTSDTNPGDLEGEVLTYGGSLPGNNSGARALCPGNQEATRTLAFVPPWDMKIVSTDLYVVCNSESAVEGNQKQISHTNPMVVKVQWIAQDGGEGYPPRPASHIPEGVRLERDPALYEIHDQFSLDVTAKGGYFSFTDNTELTLRAGKCYRICISDPDIPRVSDAFGLDEGDDEYDQTWYWRYDAAWIQLNFQYDKWQFDKVDRPDVTFFTADDPVARTNAAETGVSNQLDRLDDHRIETVEKKRYPKAELYYFGLGNFNGMWNRPWGEGASLVTTGGGTQNSITKQVDTKSLATPFSFQDSFKLKSIPDLDYEYYNNFSQQIMDTRFAHNFQFQTIWRTCLAPRFPGILDGKRLYGYSLGLAHNTSPSFFDAGQQFWLEPDITNEQTVKHQGYDFHGRLGHGVGFDPLVSASPGNYYTFNGSESSVGDNQVTPKLREENNSDGGGMAGINSEVLGWNNTSWGSTSIPPSDTSTDEHYGVASGFPGDYLAELHSGSQYGEDPDQPGLSSIGCSPSAFEKPNVTKEHNFPVGDLNNQDDLFFMLNTDRSDTGTGVSGDQQRRNFQKVYVLLWVT